MTVGVWAPIGPTAIDGNATGALFRSAFEPGNPSVIYVASPFSGVWKSEDAGASWAPITDALPSADPFLPAVDTYSPVAAIATDPFTAGRVYVVVQSGVLYRSDDRGATWTLVTVSVANGTLPPVTDLIVDRSTPDVLYVRGWWSIWRSTNGGQSWLPILDYQDNEPQPFKRIFTSLIGQEGDPYDTLYAGFAAGANSRVLMLDNPSASYSSWQNLTPDNLDTEIYDVKLVSTFTALYARFQKHLDAFVYRYAKDATQPNGDPGPWTPGTWVLLSTLPVYTEVLACVDTDRPILYLAGVNLYRSDDAGQTWNAKPVPHVDHHDFGYTETSDGKMMIYTACDGGLYGSPDLGDSWEFASNGMNTTLFYDLAVSPTDPELTIGGTQDNGTILYDGSTTVWREIDGGDGATVAIDPTNSSVLYATAGSIVRSTDGGTSPFSGIGAGLPDPICWNFHFQVHPTSPNILLASCQSLWMTQQPGDPWTVLFTSPDSDEVVVRSAIDPTTDIYYAATNQGTIYAAQSGENWQLVFSHPDRGAGCVDMVIDPDDPSIMFAAFWAGISPRRVYRLQRLSRQPGELVATAIGNGLPYPAVRTLACDAMNTATLYAGTTVGISRARWSAPDGPVAWDDYSQGMPPADVRALRVNPTTGVMRAATFGRAAYEVNTSAPVGSLVEAVGSVTFLRAHDVGTGFGRFPNYLDCEIVFQLAEQPGMSFGFQLRADAEEFTRRDMFEVLRSSFVKRNPVRIDFVKTGPRAGEVIRVANG